MSGGNSNKSNKLVKKQKEQPPIVNIKKVTAIGEVSITFGGNLNKLNSSSIEDYRTELIVVHVSKQDGSLTIGKPSGTN